MLRTGLHSAGVGGEAVMREESTDCVASVRNGISIAHIAPDAGTYNSGNAIAFIYVIYIFYVFFIYSFVRIVFCCCCCDWFYCKPP